MKRQGFTLVELLAIIIILGILMLVAIPSVSNVILSSRKGSYVSIAKAYTKEVQNKIASKKYKIKKDGVAYFIPIDIIDFDTGSKASPFGDWETFDEKITFVAYNNETIGNCSKRSSKVLDSGNLVVYGEESNSIVSNSIYNKLSAGCYKENTYSEAFVIVIYDKDNEKYDYYWTSKDVTGNTIYPKEVSKLDTEDVIISSNHVVTFETENVYGLNKNNTSSPSLTDSNKFQVSVLNSAPTDRYDHVALYLPDAEFLSGPATLTLD